MKYQLIISLMIIILVVIRVHLQILKLLMREERRRLIREKKMLGVGDKIQWAKLGSSIKNKEERLDRITKAIGNLFFCITFLFVVCVLSIMTDSNVLDVKLIEIEPFLCAIAFVLVVIEYSRINKYVK